MTKREKLALDVVSKAFDKAIKNSFVGISNADFIERLVDFRLKQGGLFRDGTQVFSIDDPNVSVATLGDYSFSGDVLTINLKLNKAIEYMDLTISVEGIKLDEN